MQNKFIARCYAKRIDGQWVAICIDFALVTQGDTFDEARRLLEAQIDSYIEDAYTVDRQYARELLSRRAPLVYRLEYHSLRLIFKIARVSAGTWSACKGFLSFITRRWNVYSEVPHLQTNAAI